jgi:hypothetical protein
MTTHFTPERLWELLPAIYRIRDAEQGGPLRALVEVLGEQAQLIEKDIARLYENWFIETCDEWVVPYIGDLLGVRNLHPFDSDLAFSQRARVANTLAFRRRKGTATMLEQLARDATGWPARAVEFFELLATTQYTNHARLHNHRAPDLRDAEAMELVNTGFDTVSHTADVRRIAPGRGLHNIPNVGLFLWRLQSYFGERTDARAATTPADGRWRFHPCGLDVPLFNRPQTEVTITQLAEEVNVPGRLRRRPLWQELEDRRAEYLAGTTPVKAYFGDQPVVQVYLDGAEEPLAPEQILVCHLGGWDAAGWSPPSNTVLTDPDGVSLETQVAVDPVLGRLVVLDGVTTVPNRVEVGWAYGFPGDVGGGPYSRRNSLDAVLTRPVEWQVTVGGGPDADFPTLTDAFTSMAPATPGWNEQPAGTAGVIAVTDAATYAEALTGAARIEIPEGSLLVIVAATPASGQPGDLEPDDLRPHLLGDVEVVGTAPADSTTPGALVIDGLLVEGELTVLDGHLGSLRIAHTTLGLHDPAAPVGVTVQSGATGNPELQLELDHSLCGPVQAPVTIRSARLLDSVVQAPPAGGGGRGPALSAAGGEAGPPALIERSTLLGSIHVRELTRGSESIFLDVVEAERLQVGCMRFSYVPQGSRTPRRYRCQPSLALAERAEALGLDGPGELPPADRAGILRRVKPAFTAVLYGDPAYVQLAASTAEEIRTGAEDGSEMGVWSMLKQPQRTANLEASLDEYLRFGLEAGFVHVT